MQSFNALWYYIDGSVAAATVISLIAWYFCKRRRTGDVHFSVLFQISLTESKRRKCLNLFNMSAKEHQSISLRIEILLYELPVFGQKMLIVEFLHICICFDNNYKFSKYHVTPNLSKFKLYCHYTEILSEYSIL